MLLINGQPVLVSGVAVIGVSATATVVAAPGVDITFAFVSNGGPQAANFNLATKTILFENFNSALGVGTRFALPMANGSTITVDVIVHEVGVNKLLSYTIYS
jgi:hypothetical protein